MTRSLLVERLDLRPHPEGGWFRETWRSPVTAQPPGYPAPRAAATAIYYLLHPGEQSRWHRGRHRAGAAELRGRARLRLSRLPAALSASGGAEHHPIAYSRALCGW